MGPKSDDKCPSKSEPEEDKPCEDKGDWSDAAISQGSQWMPGVTENNSCSLEAAATTECGAKYLHSLEYNANPRVHLQHKPTYPEYIKNL